MQGIFNDTAKIIGECDECIDEDEFLDVKGEAIFSREFWSYYSNLERIHKKMKKLKKCCIHDKEEFDSFCKLFSKPYSKEMLELSFKVVNSEVFERLDQECFFSSDKNDNKTYFDEEKSVLYIKGEPIKINIQDKITNPHKILKHIFITNKDNLTDDFFYSEIAEDEFGELEYKSSKNNWRKYSRTCEVINEKINKEYKHIKQFLKFNSGIKGKIKVNKKYL
ncbi:MAG: hypothetical protein Q7T50_07305 [Candidatus Magasanikbacteria bacterium]|nr:hypothetical protein [Candidatus Magasanikbacteria bacterium]